LLEWRSMRTLRKFPYYDKISHINRFILQQARNIFFYTMLHYHLGARGSVVGWGFMLKTLRSRVRYQVRSLDFLFSVDLILSTALWPCSRLSPQVKRLSGIFLWVTGCRCIRLTTSPPFASRLSGNVGTSMSQRPVGLHGLLQGQFYFFS
jgi:hypothetical protein